MNENLDDVLDRLAARMGEWVTLTDLGLDPFDDARVDGVLQTSASRMRCTTAVRSWADRQPRSRTAG